MDRSYDPFTTLSILHGRRSLMNGKFDEHYLDGSTPRRISRCVTCGSLVLPADEPRHIEWHKVVAEAITHPLVTISNNVELDENGDPVYTGGFTIDAGADT